MPKRKEPELDPKEQFKRFKEAANAAGLTDNEAEFERAFTTVARDKAKPKGGRPRRSGKPTSA